MTRELTALVTGASQGLGEAISVELARAGYRVALLSRRPDRLNAVRAAHPELAEALVLPADVRRWDDIQTVMQTLEGAWGGLDLLVNNAGGAFQAPAHKLSPNAFQQVVAINLIGPFVVARLAFPLLQKRHGQIVNIGSVAGRDMAPGMAAYGAAKAGLAHLTRTLAAEWGPLGIRVNCIAPGPILTEAAREVLYHNQDDRIREAARQRAVGRLGQPEDVSRAVLWMAGEDATYINGTVLYVDGGPPVTSVL